MFFFGGDDMRAEQKKDSRRNTENSRTGRNKCLSAPPPPIPRSLPDEPIALPPKNSQTPSQGKEKPQKKPPYSPTFYRGGTAEAIVDVQPKLSSGDGGFMLIRFLDKSRLAKGNKRGMVWVWLGDAEICRKF